MKIDSSGVTIIAILLSGGAFYVFRATLFGGNLGCQCAPHPR